MPKSHSFITQWQLFLLAVSFLTRIPVVIRFDVTDTLLNQASRYFALVGVGLGVILATLFYCLQFVFPASLCVLLTMALSILMTGAFHEDGWADVWDGFGGGWQVSQKLTIMKDSRLGTYGAAALIIILMMKYQSLILLSEQLNVILFAIIAGQCLSRVVATSLIINMDYVSEDATSKVKPLAMHLSKVSLFVLLFSGMMLLVVALFLAVISWQSALLIIVILVLLRVVVMQWFKSQLGGYTGDCLGAAQQASELSIYLTLAAIVSSTAV